MKSLQFEIIDTEGKNVVCDVIATYHDDNSNKDFIVYTDRTLDSNKKLKIYCSLYQMKDNNIKLIDITNSEDKKISFEIIKELISDL